MKILSYHITFFFIVFSLVTTSAQVLKPGFDKAEYTEYMHCFSKINDSAYAAKFPEPANHKRVYESPIVGLDNCWHLWIDNTNSKALIVIRGTTANTESWLANFYAAMVPAKGSLYLSKTDTFNYTLAQNPKAAVHVGWLVAMAFLAKDIMPKIDSCYTAGIKNITVFGHSQGGAIAYLLTAYLLQHKTTGRLPADIVLKTYCSAGPKPGNLYFAYEYEAATYGGWAFNVVNSADWVPETPVSIQTINDFNTTNPFVNAKEAIKKQKFPNNIVLKGIYNRLDKPTKKAQKRYQKYLGNLMSGMVKKYLGKEFKEPEYYSSNHYVRAGTMVVLLADEEYFKEFPDSKEKIFVHHFLEPYLSLTQKLPE